MNTPHLVAQICLWHKYAAHPVQIPVATTIANTNSNNNSTGAPQNGFAECANPPGGTSFLVNSACGFLHPLILQQGSGSTNGGGMLVLQSLRFAEHPKTHVQSHVLSPFICGVFCKFTWDGYHLYFVHILSTYCF